MGHGGYLWHDWFKAHSSERQTHTCWSCVPFITVQYVQVSTCNTPCAGNLVNCQLKVTSSRLITTSSGALITFCLLTPTDFDRNRVTTMVDSVSNRSTLNFRRHVMKEGAAAGRREEGQGDSLKLPEISLLNQTVITTSSRDYG